MENLREIARECINVQKGVYVKSERVVVSGGGRYITILKNGEIIQSSSESILSNQNIELAFVFPAISYSPQTNWYNSYLKPYIINSDSLVTESQYCIGDWIFEFYGQDFYCKPSPFILNIRNEKIDFIAQHSFELEDFSRIYELILKISSCTTKSEAIYVSDIYNKDTEIEILKNKVSSSEADLHVKKLAIEGYQDLLKYISNLVYSKKE